MARLVSHGVALARVCMKSGGANMAFIQTLTFILDHPLNRGRPARALARYLGWQIRSRLAARIAVPFVDDTVLLVARGMTGATGNVYCGLHEFADMAFALHFLRPGDTFVDVGANVGSYTVLASTTGAATIAFEPVASAFAALEANIACNGLATEARRCGVAGAPGVLRFSQDRDTTNCVSDCGEETPVTTLDDACRSATMVKIDVEGYEAEVIAGGGRVLSHAQSAIVELNNSGETYGFTDEHTHRRLVALGFTPIIYEPFARRIDVLPGRNPEGGNTLYVRDLEAARTRVSSAPGHKVHGVIL